MPERPSLRSLRSAIHECRACDLHAAATQAVIGGGSRDAEVMLVGEQPGDREDLAGTPFVGPAGRILDQGLERAGISTHPWAILRSATDADRRAAMDEFVADLQTGAAWLAEHRPLRG